jgi:autoinducer 2-degrading protein
MIVIIAEFTVKPENLERVLEMTRQLQDASRKEPGCERYVAHRSLEKPLHFCFYEMYADQAAIDAHRATAHYREYVTDGLMKIIENPSREWFAPLP